MLVVGDLVADQYIYGETDRISREAPVLIVRWESAEVKLGGAGNAAANLAALGAKVTAIGLLGRDELGADLREQLRALGIRFATARSSRLPTEAKTRILAGGLSTRRQQMLRLDRGHKGPVPPEVARELAELVREHAEMADAILVSDYGASAVTGPVIEAAVAAAKKVPVCVDSRYNLAAFDGATVLKPNEPELELLTGLRAEGELEVARAIALALRRCPRSSFVVTRGRHGMVVAERGTKRKAIDAHGTTEAVDVTGAGDTVGATLALALAAGMKLYEAARLANVAGALKVRKLGTVQVSAQELSNELLGEFEREGR